MNTDITERKRSAEQFRLVIEAAPTGMLMVDRNGKITLLNAQIEKLFGYRREELIGWPVEMLVPERLRDRHSEYRAGFVGDPKARPMGAGRDLYGLRKDGTEVPIEIGLNHLRTSEGDFVLASVVDITQRKRTEREREELTTRVQGLNAELEERVRIRTSELTGALKEREILLQEVHHRVKNNLQVISSLINMQLRRVGLAAVTPTFGVSSPTKSTSDALAACQKRVQAIALIHEKLYQSRDYARVRFAEYARSLAGNIFDVTAASARGISLDLVAIEDLALPVDKAIPCGLILNELITNSLKHAFPGDRRGTIRVEFASVDGGKLRLSVTDDGIGLQQGLDIQKSESLGLQLVWTLAEQLQAKVNIHNNRGASFQLTFSSEA